MSHMIIMIICGILFFKIECHKTDSIKNKCMICNQSEMSEPRYQSWVGTIGPLTADTID